MHHRDQQAPLVKDKIEYNEFGLFKLSALFFGANYKFTIFCDLL